MIGLPAGSIWWATYGAARSAIPGVAGSQHEFVQKAIGATAAATATVAAVAPLDTVKTHHQLSSRSSESAWQLAVRLVRRDGFLSLYAGSTPRWLHLAVWSTMLITIYEELKRSCPKPRAERRM